MPTDATPRCPQCPRCSRKRYALATAATRSRVGALGTPAGCCGGRVDALPNTTACPRRRPAGVAATVSSSATGCRRGGAAKEQLSGMLGRRSRPRVSCSGRRWAIGREAGAPAASRKELDVVTLEEVSVQPKPREPLRRRRLRVESRPARAGPLADGCELHKSSNPSPSMANFSRSEHSRAGPI